MIYRDIIHCTHQKLLKSMTTIFFFPFQKKPRFEPLKDDQSQKNILSATVSLCPSLKHSKLALKIKSEKKKKSELFRLFLNSLISHQQIRIFLKTPMSVCNGVTCKVHLHPLSEVTRVQENFLCFVLRSHTTEKCTNTRPCYMCWYSQMTSKDWMLKNQN